MMEDIKLGLSQISGFFSKSLPPNMFTAVGARTHTKAVDYAASLKTHPSWMSCTISGLSCVQSTRLCSLLR